MLVWSALSCIWFVLPLVCYLADPFFRKGVSEVVCAIALAAAFPLSWHLAMVAVPISELVAPRLGLSDAAMKGFHKSLGWRLAGWAAVHGFGELFYIFSAGLTNLSLASVAENGENLLYVLGVASLALLTAHALVALVRKQRWLHTHFCAVHRLTAAALLLCATAHWWPFALFLAPAAAVHGGTAAMRGARARGRHVPEQVESLTIMAACVGAVLGLAGVWTARDLAMRRPGADLLSPFTFPPAALVAEGLGAWSAAALALAVAGTSASQSAAP